MGQFKSRFLLRFFYLNLLLSAACTDQSGSQVKLTSAGEALWPNGILVYNFAPDFPEDLKKRTIDAAWNITLQTNVEVYDIQTAQTKGYNTDISLPIFYDEGGVCGAIEGYQPGKSSMLLSENCSKGNIIHEFLHALGVAHEHLNPDFQGSIDLNRVASTYENNFQTNVANRNVSGYDRQSIMHYPSLAFSVCNFPDDPKIESNPELKRCSELGFLWGGDDQCLEACSTIQGPNGQLFKSQDFNLTSYDINGINLLYANEVAKRNAGANFGQEPTGGQVDPNAIGSGYGGTTDINGCNWDDAQANNGHGWNPQTKDSCDPELNGAWPAQVSQNTSTSVLGYNGTRDPNGCNWDDSDKHGGWGYNSDTGNGDNCPPVNRPYR